MASMDPAQSSNLSHKIIKVIAAIVPVALVAGVILFFLDPAVTGMPIALGGGAESISVERTILTPGTIDLEVRNLSRQPITISALNINSTVLPFEVTPRGSIPGFGVARLHAVYSWVPGEAYTISMITAGSSVFSTSIADAENTEPPSPITLLDFTLIGLIIGFLPILWGITWFPALKRGGRGVLLFVLAFTAGVLAYLGIAASVNALNTAQQLGGAFNGAELVGVGAVGMFVLLDVMMRWQGSIGLEAGKQHLGIAWIMALGIGLQNIAEGLMVGASIRAGDAALGVILVIGFLIQNITEGIRLIGPIEKDRPPFWVLAVVSMIAGIPAIFGVWLGGYTYSQVMIVLFFAAGAGAVFESAFETYQLIKRSTVRQPMPLAVFSGVIAGMLALFLTVGFIK